MSCKSETRGQYNHTRFFLLSAGPVTIKKSFIASSLDEKPPCAFIDASLERPPRPTIRIQVLAPTWPYEADRLAGPVAGGSFCLSRVSSRPSCLRLNTARALVAMCCMHSTGSERESKLWGDPRSLQPRFLSHRPCLWLKSASERAGLSIRLLSTHGAESPCSAWMLGLQAALVFCSASPSLPKAFLSAAPSSFNVHAQPAAAVLLASCRISEAFHSPLAL